MNYVKIPRGIHVDNSNDKMIRKIIELIGKHHKGKCCHMQSDYARGKQYIRRQYNISGATLKKMHTVKKSVYGNEIDVNYSHYVMIHRTLLWETLDVLISDGCNDMEKIRRIFSHTVASTTDMDFDNQTILDILFAQTFQWMEWSARDENNFNRFNKNDNAHKLLLETLENKPIYEVIGEL